MDVGILTMHRVLNYGSFMQAFALKREIESFGHRVQFRDFRHGEARHKGRKVKVPGLLDKVARVPVVMCDLAGTVRKRAFRRKFNDYFRQTCWKLLDVPVSHRYDLSADAMVIGSDEVFNYTQNHSFGYVPCLFGHEIEAPLVMSYAASAGYANSGDVVADGMIEELANGLRRMRHISVRDENTREMVKACTGESPTIVLDPTLVHDFDDVIPERRVMSGDYLVVYAYEGRLDSPAEIEAVRQFAAKYRLKTVSAGAFHGWCDENIVISPFELLKLFADAAYVVTDTFHGSIFAMKGRRPFATFVRDHNPLGSNANKVRYLLEQFGMESRIVNDPSGLAAQLETPAPYAVFDERLDALRKTSREFLEAALA